MTIVELIQAVKDLQGKVAAIFTSQEAQAAKPDPKIEELKQAVAALGAKVDGELTKALADIAALTAQLAESSNQVNDASAKVINLEARLADPKSEGARIAAETCAKLGVHPLAIKPDAATPGAEPTDVLAQYNDLLARDPLAAAKFYAVNREKFMLLKPQPPK